MATTRLFGVLLFGAASAASVVLVWRLARYRTLESRPSLLENWWKALDGANYSSQGQELLRRVLPWIWVLVALQLIGVVTFVAYS